MATSVSRKIGFAHVPKTAVYNGTTKNWDYIANPTQAQLTQSANQLKEIDSSAITAKTQATAAKAAADSKATVAEAVEGTREDLFTFTPLPLQSGAVEYRKFDRIEFVEIKSSLWEINLYYHKMSDPTTYYGWLNYASRSDLDDLEARVAAIEQRLGISS